MIANAQDQPSELHGLACHATMNFPWGSLLQGLLTDDSAVVDGLLAVTRAGAQLEVRLNPGALAESGWSLDAGADRVRDVLADNGFDLEHAITLAAHDLKRLPTTWAKRLAFGRDPRAVNLCGRRRTAIRSIKRHTVPLEA